MKPILLSSQVKLGGCFAYYNIMLILETNNMKKDQLKALVKEYFALADAPSVVENTTEESFGHIATADGSVELYYEGDSVEVGTKLEIVDAEGNRIPAPAGEHLLADGKRVVLDEEGVVKEFLVESDEAPEEMADYGDDEETKMMEHPEEEEKMMEEKMLEVSEEIAEAVIEEALEEEAPLMDIAPIVEAVVESLMEEMKKEMAKMREEMSQVKTEVETKVESFAKAPATGRTIPGTPAKGEALKSPANVFNAERWNQVMSRIKK